MNLLSRHIPTASALIFTAFAAMANGTEMTADAHAEVPAHGDAADVTTYVSPGGAASAITGAIPDFKYHSAAGAPASTRGSGSAPTAKSRLQIGGYGEAVFSRFFYSDDYKRYTNPERHKDKSHGRFDIPHVVIYLGYDFGKGWSMGSEIEFEHGGVEAAVEIEKEESGEYETEVERGGEVNLEQFWIQKEFFPQLKIRAGLQVVPVGATNAHHEPDRFFGVYRPEGENTILPCTWREISVSVQGRAGKWSYMAMFMPGLDSERFGNESWIKYGSPSPFEFKIANSYAVAARVDNYSVPGLRLSVSGYAGNSFRNTLYPQDKEKTRGVSGTVTIGSFDFEYNAHHVVARGYFDYGHLSDSERISAFNIGMSQNSTSKRQEVGSDAMAAGAEAGYDLFSLFKSRHTAGQKFYAFARWEYYNSMLKVQNAQPLNWCHRHRYAAGINWQPIRQVIIKGEYSYGRLDSRYNNEPAVSFGVCYSGWFIR